MTSWGAVRGLICPTYWDLLGMEMGEANTSSPGLLELSWSGNKQTTQHPRARPRPSGTRRQKGLGEPISTTCLETPRDSSQVCSCPVSRDRSACRALP